MGKGILESDPYLHGVPGGIRNKMHVDLLPKGNIGDADLAIEE